MEPVPEGKSGVRMWARGRVATIAGLGMLLISASAAGGDTSWTNQFGTEFDDEVSGIAATADGIFVAGTSDASPGSPGDSDAFVRRFSHTGEAVWSVEFGSVGIGGSRADDTADDIATDSSKLFVTGTTNGGVLPGETEFGKGAYIQTFELDGTQGWSRQFGADASDRGTAIATTSDAIVVAGLTFGAIEGPSAGNIDAFVRMYDKDGNALWTDQFGSPADDAAYGVAASENAVYVAGATEGRLPGETRTGGDAFIRKYESDGTVVWTTQFGTNQDDEGWAVAITEGGAFVTGETEGAFPGYTNPGPPSDDAFVTKFGNDGDMRWTRQFGTIDEDAAHAVADTRYGILLTGRTTGGMPGHSNIGGYDVWVSVRNSAGNALSTRQFGTTRDDSGNAVMQTDGVVVAGDVGGTLRGETSEGASDGFVAMLEPQPDALIRKGAGGSLAGNGVYNTTGAEQTRRGRASRGTSVTFYITAQNDAAIGDSLRIDGCAPSSGFGVKYLAGTTGRTNITKQVVEGNYVLKNLVPGGSGTLRLKLTVRAGAAIGAAKSCLTAVTSETDADAVDVVKARVQAISA